MSEFRAELEEAARVAYLESLRKAGRKGDRRAFEWFRLAFVRGAMFGMRQADKMIDRAKEKRP